MPELRGKSDIGDRINTQVIAPLVQANTRLAHSDFPDFCDKCCTLWSPRTASGSSG